MKDGKRDCYGKKTASSFLIADHSQKEDFKLLNSRPIAERRLHLMERKMDKNVDFSAGYLKKFKV
jgi:hypothetical protein